jgi:hypothetical protein
MITPSDSFTTIDLGAYYAILPGDGKVLKDYLAAGIVSQPVQQGFAYNSGTNPEVLTVDQLRQLIRDHVDPEFQPV